MLNSLKLRLFLLIAGITVIVWSGAAVWTSISTKAEVEHVLDRRLVEAARMVAALDLPATGQASRLEPAPYSRQLSCQIWSLAGALVGQSAGAPEAPMASGAPGFSDREIRGEHWRVYTHVDKVRGIRVMVGDSMAVRQRLVQDLMLGLVLPAAVGLIALALLLWLGIRGGLAPLERIRRAIDERSPDSLLPLQVHPVPPELMRMVSAMDALLIRLEAARRAEREFVANAAHELQTPLAGLKTQAEVAQRATDPVMRNNALAKISASVDRTSGLVRQLLDLAAQEGGASEDSSDFTPLGSVAREIALHYADVASAKSQQIEISPTLNSFEIAIDRAALMLAMGNLVENAVHHGGKGAITIECSTSNRFELFVYDSGAGIAPGDGDRLRRRFERGSTSGSGGTGLGFSIVEAAIKGAEGRLEFRQRQHDFAAVLSFPSHRARRVETAK